MSNPPGAVSQKLAEEVGEISQSPEKSHGDLDAAQRRLPRGPWIGLDGSPSDVNSWKWQDIFILKAPKYILNIWKCLVIFGEVILIHIMPTITLGKHEESDVWNYYPCCWH